MLSEELKMIRCADVPNIASSFSISLLRSINKYMPSCYSLRIINQSDADIGSSFERVLVPSDSSFAKSVGEYIASGGTTPIGDYFSIIDDEGNVYWGRVERYDASLGAFVLFQTPPVPASGSRRVYLCWSGSSTYLGSMDTPDELLFYETTEGDFLWSNYQNGVVSKDSTVQFSGSYSIKKSSYADPNGGYRLLPYSISRESGKRIVLDLFTIRIRDYSDANATLNRYGIENSSFDGYGPMVWYDYNNDLYGWFGNEKRDGGIGDLGSFCSGGTATVDISIPGGQWLRTRMSLAVDKINTELWDYYYQYYGSTDCTDTSVTYFDRVVIHGGFSYWTDDIIVFIGPDPLPKVEHLGDANLRNVLDTF